MSEIEYKTYNNKLLIIYGDKTLYNDTFENIDAHWKTNVAKGFREGWLVSKSKEASVKKLVESINKEIKLKEAIGHAKSRKNQHKYHRALSESDSGSGSESKLDLVVNESKKSLSNCDSLEKSSHEVEEQKKVQPSNNILNKYKVFNKKTSEYKNTYYPSDSESSYSTEYNSYDSYDNFPSPSTPTKRDNYCKKEDPLKHMFNKVKNIERKMYEMELQNRKKTE